MAVFIGSKVDPEYYCPDCGYARVSDLGKICGPCMKQRGVEKRHEKTVKRAFGIAALVLIGIALVSYLF